MIKKKNDKLYVLFLSQRFLFPMDTGGKIRTAKILENLKIKFNLTIISNVESPKDDPYLLKMSGLCDKFVPVPWKETKKYTPKFYWKLFKKIFSSFPISVLNDYSKELENTILNELGKNKYDLAVCDFLQSALNFKNVKNIPILLFQHNIETTITKRHFNYAKNPILKLFWWLQYIKMYNFEKRICHYFDAVVVVSEKDQKRLKKWFDIDNVYQIPTGVDTDYYYPMENIPLKKQLIFVGSMDWLPNEDAIFYFITDIFPLIKLEEPDLKLLIVGRNPTKKLIKFVQDYDNVEITGWVEDTRPYIAESTIFIVPLRIAGGTRIKIYEAMAMGKVVVSTTIGAEGLPVINGEHIVLVDDKKKFADHIIKLIQNPTEHEKIGNSARNYIRNKFRWDKVSEHFAQNCINLVDKYFTDHNN